MKIYSVNECGGMLSQNIQKNYIFRNMAVRGIIRGIHIHFSGVVYFNLTDEKSRISCFIGKAGAAFLSRKLENGMEATLIGDIRYNSVSGWPVLFVHRVISTSKSTYQEEKELLEEQLKNQGYFDPALKRKIPAFPFHIGIISSASGAVVHDIIKTGSLRNDAVRYTLFNTAVQGEGAALSIVHAIEAASSSDDTPDVLILARGGGAEDDLSPFNEKIVLDAIFNCSIPVVSAIGHETDVTLADLTADLRASTPTQAAELVIPMKKELIIQIRENLAKLEEGRKKYINYDLSKISHLLLSFRSPDVYRKQEQIKISILFDYLTLQKSAYNMLRGKYKEVLGMMAAFDSLLTETGGGKHHG